MRVNDAEYDEQKARVERLFERWVRTIGLGWWRIQYVWHREEKRGDTTLAEGDTCVMDCRADWRYLHATINVYLPTIVEEDDERLEYLCVHELMHIFLNEMRASLPTQEEANAMGEHEERVATTLAHGFLWARKAGRDEGWAT